MYVGENRTKNGSQNWWERMGSCCFWIIGTNNVKIGSTWKGFL